MQPHITPGHVPYPLLLFLPSFPLNLRTRSLFLCKLLFSLFHYLLKINHVFLVAEDPLEIIKCRQTVELLVRGDEVPRGIDPADLQRLVLLEKTSNDLDVESSATRGVIFAVEADLTVVFEENFSRESAHIYQAAIRVVWTKRNFRGLGLVLLVSGESLETVCRADFDDNWIRQSIFEDNELNFDG